MKNSINQLEFKDLKEKIASIDWDEPNLYKHTIKHPIGDWQNKNNIIYKLLWGNILGIHDIPLNENEPKFDETKRAYRRVSLDILSKLYNAVIYFHNGKNNDSNKLYRSIGIFEDREYKPYEKVLITYIRGVFSNNKEYFYITTCYFKDRGFKEKFYYAYMLLQEPELFKVNMDINNFFNKNGIPRNFSFDRLDELLDKSKLSDDKVGEIFNYYIDNKRIDTSRYHYLKCLYNDNEYVKDIKNIENKIKLNNYVISLLKKKIEQLDDDCLNDNERIIANRMSKIDSNKWFTDVVKNIKSNLLKKYSDDESVNDLFLKMIDNFKFDEYLFNLYERGTVLEIDFNDFYDDCILTLNSFIIALNPKFEQIKISYKDLDYNLKEYCINLSISSIIKKEMINIMIRYIKDKNSLLYVNKDSVMADMYMDDENLFYMSLYKSLAKFYFDYVDDDFKYDMRYDYKINKIIEEGKNN